MEIFYLAHHNKLIWGVAGWKLNAAHQKVKLTQMRSQGNMCVIGGLWVVPEMGIRTLWQSTGYH